ncbi:MAG: hypothetical protein V4629_03855 [Pseudomonadota bacterium]
MIMIDCFKNLCCFYKSQSAANSSERNNLENSDASCLLHIHSRSAFGTPSSNPIVCAETREMIRAPAENIKLSKVSTSNSLASFSPQFLQEIAPRNLSMYYTDQHYYGRETECHHSAQKVFDYFRDKTEDSVIYSTFTKKSTALNELLFKTITIGNDPKVFLIHLGYCDIEQEKRSVQHSLVIKRENEGFQLFQSFASKYSLNEFLTGEPDMSFKRPECAEQNYASLNEFTSNELHTLSNLNTLDLQDLFLAIQQKGVIQRLPEFTSTWGRGRILTKDKIHNFVNAISDMGKLAEQNDVHGANAIAYRIFGTEAFNVFTEDEQLSRGEILNWKTGYPLYVEINSSDLKGS